MRKKHVHFILLEAVHTGVSTSMLNRCNSFLTPESFDQLLGNWKSLEYLWVGLAIETNSYWNWTVTILIISKTEENQANGLI